MSQLSEMNSEHFCLIILTTLIRSFVIENELVWITTAKSKNKIFNYIGIVVDFATTNFPYWC